MSTANLDPTAHASSLTNHNPSNYSTNASFVYSSAYTAPVLDILEAQAGEKIIDLGCGTGELTRLIYEKVTAQAAGGGRGEVIGVDSSSEMLDKASSYKDYPIPYIRADIQDLPTFVSRYPQYKGHFDAVFTNATLHWCKDPKGVIELVGWLLRPGGRMAFEFGGFGNCVGIRAGLHQALKKRGIDPVPLDPWYFPTVGQYEAVLRSSSPTNPLTPQSLHLVPRPTPLPTSLRGWLDTFARSTFLSSFDDRQAGEILDDVVEICKVDNYWSEDIPGNGNEDGMNVKGKGEPGPGKSSASGSGQGKEKEKKEGWEVMYVRLRGSAIKPE
ncbi:hypothetical protein I317_03344 [Kwoniella heveanensis CBS 569]|uniref:Methyltransferase domain-containing protein n=1 Tax=Kwoniella heveanensis BCC8398 TaxID=1296120 RepID=A0A1B9GLJ8_9TREE|nr:hypothetical protein I316_06439 [Kwoniella heveanensis BCC8398]OCF42867.1 hypothetical protein I317_03344 [Kwoniella heveanensis CBS 569]